GDPRSSAEAACAQTTPAWPSAAGYSRQRATILSNEATFVSCRPSGFLLQDAVADSANCLDNVRRARVIAEFAPQPGNPYVDRAVEGFKIPAETSSRSC